MSYDPEQKQVIKAIKRIGRRRGEERVKIKAALETGIVESNFRNLGFGDADSKGWRQERASLYKNPTNLKASINRFYDEADQLYKGQHSGRLAADVQRPAAQYRGRYAGVAGEAKKLLHGGLKGPGSSTKVDGYTLTTHKFGRPERKVEDVDGAVLDALMNRKGGSLLKAVAANLDSGEFTKTIPGTKDKTIKTKIKGGKIEGVTAKAPAAHGGAATFEGKQVAAWMVPALKYARQHGWKGHVTSGVRTRAEQKVLYANRAHNPYPVAAPGTSNHEIENGGAIDASDYSTLAAIMKHYPGKKLVQGTAINDPVHFSSSGR